MNYKIVDATETHVPDITRIYNQYLGSATMYLTPRKESYFIHLLENLDEREGLKILKADDLLLGWSLIQKYSPKEGYRYACETSTYIDQPYLGKGHGSYLKKHIIKECSNLGYKYIVARILSDNKVSIQYNLKLGYKIVGIQKNIGMVNDQWVDVTIMECHLP